MISHYCLMVAQVQIRYKIELVFFSTVRDNDSFDL